MQTTKQRLQALAEKAYLGRDGCIEVLTNALGVHLYFDSAGAAERATRRLNEGAKLVPGITVSMHPHDFVDLIFSVHLLFGDGV